MTLPNATLFPQSLLPLYIFEPRYRQMLADALHSTRMFTVAMQRPGSTRETPLGVAGLGFIRVSVGHRDGTSHLVLQGLARVELGETLRYKPYRIQRIKRLATPPCDNVKVDALLAKLRELLHERLEMGLPFPFPAMTPGKTATSENASPVVPKDVIEYLDSVSNPEQAADLICCAVLPGPADRQMILETVDVETRLRRLIQFLLAEIRRKGKGSQS